MEKLRKNILQGIRPEGSRFDWWTAFLGLVSLDSTQQTREMEMEKQRKSYFELKMELMKEPHGQADPLSESAENPWHQYFKDQELKQTIKQDVERTFPDLGQFHTTEAQKLLETVLFIWCRQHPDPSYRQGMHEVAAVVYWVVLAHNSHEMEANVYLLFTRIMAGMSNLYIGPTLLNLANHATAELLPLIDDNLAKSMEIQELEPSVYGIRWLRLLFAREFSQEGEWLERVCQLWDGIFSVEPAPTQPSLQMLNDATALLHPMESWSLQDSKVNNIANASILEWAFCHFLCTARSDLVVPQKVLDYATKSAKRVVYRNNQHVALSRLMKYDYPSTLEAWMIVPTSLHIRAKVLEEVRSSRDSQDLAPWEVVDSPKSEALKAEADSLSETFSRLMSNSTFWKLQSTQSSQPGSANHATDSIKSRLDSVVGQVLRKPPLMDNSPRVKPPTQPVTFDLDKIRELVIASLSQCQAVIATDSTEEDRLNVLNTVARNLKQVIVTLDGDSSEEERERRRRSRSPSLESRPRSSSATPKPMESDGDSPVSQKPTIQTKEPSPVTASPKSASLESPFPAAAPVAQPGISVVPIKEAKDPLLASLMPKSKASKLRRE
jgi:hypothetical protein